LDIRETQCGDENTIGVRLKLVSNRHSRKPCDAAEDGDELDEEEEQLEDEEDDEDEEEQEEEARRTSV